MKGPPSPLADFWPDQTWIIVLPKETIEPDRPASIGQFPDLAGIFGVPLPTTIEEPLLLVPEPPPEPVLLPAVELPELLLPLPPLPDLDEPLLGRALDPDPPDPDAEPDPPDGWPVVLPVPEVDDPLLGVVADPASVSVSIDGVTSPVAQPIAAVAQPNAAVTVERRND